MHYSCLKSLQNTATGSYSKKIKKSSIKEITFIYLPKCIETILLCTTIVQKRKFGRNEADATTFIYKVNGLQGITSFL